MAALGIVSTSVVRAQGTGDSNLVEKIATRFNLSQDEVQAVFDEEHESREAEMQTQFSAQLQAKVDEGVITDAQKTLLEEKMAAMHDEREAAREAEGEFTHAERHAKMKAKRTELKKWLKDNGIPTDILSELRPQHHGGPMGRHTF